MGFQQVLAGSNTLEEAQVSVIRSKFEIRFMAVLRLSQSPGQLRKGVRQILGE